MTLALTALWHRNEFSHTAVEHGARFGRRSRITATVLPIGDGGACDNISLQLCERCALYIFPRFYLFRVEHMVLNDQILCLFICLVSTIQPILVQQIRIMNRCWGGPNHSCTNSAGIGLIKYDTYTLLEWTLFRRLWARRVKSVSTRSREFRRCIAWCCLYLDRISPGTSNADSFPVTFGGFFFTCST